MRTLHFAASMLCVACLGLTAAAQQMTAPSTHPKPPATAATMPAPEPVLQHIPADAMGYVVVNNVAGLMGKVDGYLETIGLGELLAAQMPEGTLAVVKGLAMLGDGFNANGGLAAVLLDPAKFGVDLIAIMEQGPATQPEEVEQKVPFVLLVPGESVEGVFGNYPIVQGAKYAEVQLRMGKMFATKLGGYIALAPSSEVLDAMKAQAPKAPSGLSAKQADLLARSDISLTINMAAAAPIIQAMIVRNQQQMAKKGAPAVFVKMMSVYSKLTGEVLSQILTYTGGLRFGQTGLVFEDITELVPDSDLGKAMASWQAPKEIPLNRLPNLPYVLAIGGSPQVETGGQQPFKEMGIELLDQLLADCTSLDDQTKQDAKMLATEWIDQIAGVQIVGGGAPPDSGVFGVSCVLACNDSAKVRSILAQAPELVGKIVKAVSGEEEDQVQIIGAQDVDTVEGVSVDSIEIAPPATVTVEEDVKAQMSRAMGEPRLCIYVAPIDEHTVVVTFGGAKPFLAEAIKTAKAGNGTIASDPATAAALKEMPDNLMSIVLINVGNGVQVAIQAAIVISGPQSAFPFQITTKTPIALGAGAQGSAVHRVCYIPNDLVQEGVGIVKMFLMPRPRPTTMPATSSQPQGQEAF